MPYDVLLTDAGDLPRETRALTSGVELVLQRVAIRLGLHRGEFKLDTTKGLPYLAWLQQKPPDVDAIALALRREIAATPGVDAVLSLTGTFTIATRTLSFTGRVRIAGEAVPVEVVVPTGPAGSQNRVPRLISPFRSIASPGVSP